MVSEGFVVDRSMLRSAEESKDMSGRADLKKVHEPENRSLYPFWPTSLAASAHS